MRALKRFAERPFAYSVGQRQETRLKHEIEEHLVMQTEENLRAGLPPDEVHRQAPTSCVL